ncbi:hypothetical protein LXL04_021161 [Taraxacum kok-saghyz]
MRTKRTRIMSDATKINTNSIELKPVFFPKPPSARRGCGGNDGNPSGSKNSTTFPETEHKNSTLNRAKSLSCSESVRRFLHSLNGSDWWWLGRVWWWSPVEFWADRQSQKKGQGGDPVNIRQLTVVFMEEKYTQRVENGGQVGDWS